MGAWNERNAQENGKQICKQTSRIGHFRLWLDVRLPKSVADLSKNFILRLRTYLKTRLFKRGTYKFDKFKSTLNCSYSRLMSYFELFR